MTGRRARRAPQRLECDCWCGLVVLRIPAEWVAEGRTGSCGGPGCTEDGKVYEGGEETELIDRYEVAERMGYSNSNSVNNLVKSGRLVPAAKQRTGMPGGPRALYRASDVERLIRERAR